MRETSRVLKPWGHYNRSGYGCGNTSEYNGNGWGDGHTGDYRGSGSAPFYYEDGGFARSDGLDRPAGDVRAEYSDGDGAGYGNDDTAVGYPPDDVEVTDGDEREESR